MGMFDSLYDQLGREWQTKALARSLNRYEIGDKVPGPPLDHQMEVIGDHNVVPPYRWAFANIRGGRLAELPVDRDPSLPVRLYSSGWESATEGETDGYHEVH
jgi:hypothetical protein